MPTKTCLKCGEEKSLEEFYRHPQMTDGHRNKCKDCAKKDARENRSKRRSQYAAYERQRFRDPKRKAQLLEAQRRRRVRYPEKDKARHAVNNAIRDGKLERGMCEVCGEVGQAHHEDYSRPLDVRWLCLKHHRQEHDRVVNEEIVA